MARMAEATPTGFVNTYKDNGYEKVILYGPPKTGKSAAAGKLAKHYNILWVDGENGVSVLLNEEIGLTPEDLSHIELVQCKDMPAQPIFPDLSKEIVKFKVFTFCETHGRNSCPVCRQANLPMTTIDFKNIDDSWIIVFDSLTQLSNSVMNAAKMKRGVLASNLTDTKAEWDDYGLQGTWMDNFLTCIQNAPYNIIVISHEVDVAPEGMAERLNPVGGTRNFSKQVARYFGHVVRCELKAKKHTAASSTTYASNAITGSRLGVKCELHTDSNESILRPIFMKYTNHKLTTEVASGTTEVTGAADAKVSTNP